MIQASGLRRTFGSIVAVDGISLEVPDGAILALLGPNGAGKSTTVRMLAGLLAPTDGQATVAGYDVRTQPAAVRAHVGLVTDSPGLYNMPPEAYLDFFGRVYGLDKHERRQRIDELLDLFELREARGRRMAGFSRGMQQKVALARALLHQPAVLFLDEPTTGLDPLGARSVRELILRLRNASRSIVLCTHDLDEAERLADSVAILSHGRVLAADATDALRSGATAETLVRISLALPFPSALKLAATTPGVLHPQAPSATLLTYRTLDPRATNPALITALAAAGAAIVSVQSDTASLEDIYAAALGQPATANGAR